MQKLSGIDTMFLSLESALCPMHVGGLILIEPHPGGDGAERFAKVRAHIESRLHLMPPLRRRLVTPPLNLDQPYWLEDPDFDIANHVKHKALPQPGSDEQLVELVCEHVARELDRSLPLWDFNLVDGLAGDRSAVVTKVHHAAVDGISGAEPLSHMLDLSPEPRPTPPPEPPWKPDKVPTALELAGMSVRTLARRPGEALRLFHETMAALLATGRDVLAHRGADPQLGLTAGALGIAPRTRFNRQITARRAYAFGSLPLAEIKAVKNHFRTTVNDVVLALCAEALRRYLEERGELPPRSLITGVPMSTRQPDQKDAGGNHVTFLRASLHTEVADPIARLGRISAEMAVLKERQRGIPANLLTDWAEFPAPAIMARAARLFENFAIQDYLSPPFNLVISNVPGPSKPLYLAGSRVLAHHPISIPYHGLGLNITLISYCGSLDYGITADADAVPDLDRLAGHLHEAHRTFLEATRQAAAAPAS